MKKYLAIFIAVLLTAFIIIGSVYGAQSPRGIKNVIIMISDGCGYNHIDAASLYQYGKTGRQIYEKFPIKYGMSTYPGSIQTIPGEPEEDQLGDYDPISAWTDFNYVLNKATDSAAAATTMATGVKTYNFSIGMDMYGVPMINIMQKAESAGKSTGVVSSVQWSHATPAGFVVHCINRASYTPIAQEMIYNSETDVIMGAGHPWFDDNSMPISTPNLFKFVGGEATWNALKAGIAGNDADRDGVFDPWTLIESRNDFLALANGETPKRVLGTAQVCSTLQQARQGDGYAEPYEIPQNYNVPTLAEMAKGAINVLDSDADGFCLMIEGGAVDWASHSRQPGRMIEEQIDFNRCVETVVDWVENYSNWKETLLIITGDHETGYLTGPDSYPNWTKLISNGIYEVPEMEFQYYSHTNSIIPFFAKGTGSKLFNEYICGKDPVCGKYIDNTSIAQVIGTLLQSSP